MELIMMGCARLMALGLAVLCLAGCESSPTAEPDRHAIPAPGAQYAGLPGQSVAVMVWADWSTSTEYSKIQLELARKVQERLEGLYAVEAPVEGKKPKDERPPTTFINPASVVRFQREHPEIEGQPIAQVAPRLGVTRVVYIEIENFDAHAPHSIMLLKGSGKAALRVLEVGPDGQAVVAFEERGIAVEYPPSAPEGVIPDQKKTVRWIYEGTIARLAEAIAVRFAPPAGK